MADNRWDSLRYTSAIPWGNSPIPLIPSALRNIYHSESAPLPEALVRSYRLTVRDLDTTFWAREIEIDDDHLGQILRWAETKIPMVANSPILDPSRSKRVEIASLALPTAQLNVLAETVGRNYIEGNEVQFEQLLTRFDFQFNSIVKLACLLEAATPILSDSSRLSLASAPEPPLMMSPERHVSAPRLSDDLEQPMSAFDSLRERVRDVNAVNNAFRDLYESISDPRLVVILYDRTIAMTDKRPLSDLAKEFGVGYERTRQLEMEARSLLQRTRSRKFGPLRDLSNWFSEAIGSAVPTSSTLFQQHMAIAVDDIEDPDLNKFARHILLWLAGPFTQQRNWLVSKRRLIQQTSSVLAEYADDRHYVSWEDTESCLKKLGIKSPFHRDWLKNFSEIVAIEEGDEAGGYLICTGEFLDRIHTLLAFHNRSFSLEEIIRHLGHRNTRGIRFRLLNDKRFWRINKPADFVIAGTEGYRQYRGITREIEHEIEVSGGLATVDEIVHKLHTSFEVTPNSVLAYVKTPHFRIDPTTKRVTRSTAADWTPLKELTDTGHCYHIDGQWIWRITINADWLRGSGRTCPDAFATKLGARPDTPIKVDSKHPEDGQIAIGWKLASPSGAHIGSLKRVIQRLKLNIGDHLFVVIDELASGSSAELQLDFRPLFGQTLDDCENEFDKLAYLVGYSNPNAETRGNWEIIGDALGMDRDKDDQRAIHNQLAKRGERELASMLLSMEVPADQTYA